MGEYMLGIGNVHIDDPVEMKRAEALRIPLDIISFSATSAEEAIAIAAELREKNSTGSPLGESGFTPEGALGKTVGLSYKRPEGAQ